MHDKRGENGFIDEQFGETNKWPGQAAEITLSAFLFCCNISLLFGHLYMVGANGISGQLPGDFPAVLRPAKPCSVVTKYQQVTEVCGKG